MGQKILYTTSYDDIIESISEICNCRADNIRDYIQNSQPFKNTAIRDVRYKLFFNEIGINFNGHKEMYETIKFDSVVVSHLTTRITEPDTTDIYYLGKVLTERTDISDFLASKRLYFKRSPQGLMLYYNKEVVDWNNFNSSIASRIKVRLRVNGSYMDNCINGFLFNHLFWEDGDVEHIRDCPEILSDICHVLRRNDIIKEWGTLSKSYALGFLAEVKDIIFDEHTKFRTTKSKIYLIYKYVIYYLIQNYHGVWNPRFDNPKIRLHDNESVSKDKIIGFYEIKR